MGTLSTVYIDDNAFCYSIEQNWLHNQPFLSCVPDGVYELVEFESEKYGSTFAIYNPDRDVYVNKGDMANDTDRYACLLHKANWAHELQGCIAFGQTVRCGRKESMADHQLMITNSRVTTSKIIDMLKSSSNNELEIYRKTY